MLRESSRKSFSPRPYVIRRRMLRQFPHFSKRLRENYFKRFSSNGESRPYLAQNVHFLKRDAVQRSREWIGKVEEEVCRRLRNHGKEPALT